MTGITWLHLSDWHEGHSGEALYDRTLVREQLLDDIEQRIQRISRSGDLDKIDFIVFSGDAAFSGKKKQYEQVEEFFDRVLEASGLEGQRDRLFIVPGNHDLEGDQLQNLGEKFHQPLDTESNALKDWIQEFLTPDQIRTLLLTPFSSYKSFVSRYTGQDQPSYASFKSLLCNNGVKVALLGLNSALMARRRNDKGEVDDLYKLVIGEPQVDSRLRDKNLDIQGHDVKIAVMHHPLNWLCHEDQERIRPLLTSNFHFVLYGHRHKIETSQVVQRSGDCVFLAAGATYESREHLNSYNLVHYDPVTKKGKVYLRRWDNDLRQWVKAPFLSGNQVVYSGCYQFPPPPPPKHLPPPTPIGEQTWTKEERDEELKEHYAALAEAITEGTIVPILGADINLCGRPQTQVSNPWAWKLEGAYPPTNVELAAYIESKFQTLATIECPFGEPCTPDNLSDQNCFPRFPSGCPLNTRQISWIDLPHISQFFWSRSQQYNDDRLTSAINNIYMKKYRPNALYEFLATSLIESCACEEIELAKKGSSPFPLLITTCFDRTLERAFYKHQQPYDWLSYSAQDMRFRYQKYDWVFDEDGNRQFGSSSLKTVAEASKNKDAFSLKLRPVILRLYGPILQEEGEHFAITEDHFLKYLIHADRRKLPENLLAKLRHSHLWFLGYNLSYWYLRIILHLIAQRTAYRRSKNWNWAVQKEPQRLERELWDINKIKLFTHLSIPSLEEYIGQVSQKLNP